jgi:hypothetical protein
MIGLIVAQEETFRSQSSTAMIQANIHKYPALTSRKVSFQKFAPNPCYDDAYARAGTRGNSVEGVQRRLSYDRLDAPQ